MIHLYRALIFSPVSDCTGHNVTHHIETTCRQLPVSLFWVHWFDVNSVPALSSHKSELVRVGVAWNVSLLNKNNKNSIFKKNQHQIYRILYVHRGVNLEREKCSWRHLVGFDGSHVMLVYPGYGKTTLALVRQCLVNVFTMSEMGSLVDQP